jgi:hypothetical protein
VYRRLWVYEHALTGSLPDPGRPAGVEIAPLTADDAEEYAAFRPQLTPDEVRARLARGDRCLVARAGGRLVHVRWTATESLWIDYLRCRVRLGPGDVVGYEAYTDPAFRRRGISAAVGAEKRRRLRDEGFRRNLSFVLPENIAAVHGLERRGSLRIGVIGVVRLGRWARAFAHGSHGAVPATG